MCVYRKNFVFLHECMSARVGNTINHALSMLHDIEAISRDNTVVVFSTICASCTERLQWAPGGLT
jgi:hypothetical protein